MAVVLLVYKGGDLGDSRGRSPPKFEMGDGPCLRPPIIQTIVIAFQANYVPTQ